MAKRKYEIEQLQGMPSSQTKLDVNLDVNLQTKSETKSINKKTEKTVSFDDNVTYEHIDNYNENDNKEENIINMNNIFSKLKKNQTTSYSQSEPQLEKETTAYKIQILEDKIDKINQKIDTILNKLLGL